MDKEQLLKIHNDPLDPWEPVHAAARIVNNQVALYPHNHNSTLAARQLDALTPFNRKLKLDEQPESISSFLWEFWEVVIKLSQAYEQKNDQAQACIVEILGKLKKIEAQEVTIWGKQTRLWGNLPLFGPALTELHGNIYKDHGSRRKLIVVVVDMSQHSDDFRAFLDKIQAAGLIEVSATDMPLTESNADTTIQALATRLVAIAPKIKQFYVNRFVAPTTEIRFEHRQNAIFCTCRHQWNDNVTYTI